MRLAACLQYGTTVRKRRVLVIPESRAERLLTPTAVIPLRGRGRPRRVDTVEKLYRGALRAFSNGFEPKHYPVSH